MRNSPARRGVTAPRRVGLVPSCPGRAGRFLKVGVEGGQRILLGLKGGHEEGTMDNP